MPFFHGSSGVNIHGGDFKDIVGNHNIYHNAVHNENSGNTTNTTTTNSNNDSSVRTGPTRNIYTSRTHSGPKYSANFVKGADQDNYYRQQPPTESGYEAHDRYIQEDRLARQKVEAALKRSIEPRPAYNAYGIYNQGDNEEEYAWQPSNAQPRGSFSHAQSAPVTQSSPFPEPSPYQQDEMARRKARDALRMSNDWPRSDPYEMRDDQDANSWSSSTAQPQPSSARVRSNPIPVAQGSFSHAQSAPVTQSSPFPKPSLYQQDEMARRKARDALRMSNDWPRSDPYEMRDDQDANSWSSSIAQPQPSFTRARSNPFPVDHSSPLEASPSPPPMKSKNPFLNIVDSQGGQAPTRHQPTPLSRRATVSSDEHSDEDTEPDKDWH